MHEYFRNSLLSPLIGKRNFLVEAISTKLSHFKLVLTVNLTSVRHVMIKFGGIYCTKITEIHFFARDLDRSLGKESFLLMLLQLKLSHNLSFLKTWLQCAMLKNLHDPVITNCPIEDCFIKYVLFKVECMVPQKEYYFLKYFSWQVSIKIGLSDIQHNNTNINDKLNIFSKLPDKFE